MMPLWMNIFLILYFICTITPLFGQVLVFTVMIRSKLIRNTDNSYLLVGMLLGDFLACSATLWQFALNVFIDPPGDVPFLTKGQCLLMEGPNIAGLTISQIATLSLAVDRMNSLRDPMAYYQKLHFQSAMYWWVVEGIFGLVHGAMPQIANDIDTVVNHTDPTWPTWFRWYWMGFSIIASVLVLSAYVLVMDYSRKKNTSFAKNETSLAYERSVAREKLITKTVLRVLTVYVLFWGLPSILYNVTVFFDVGLASLFGLVMMLGSVFCSLANVIFLLMRGDVRSGVKSLFGWRQQELQSISNTTGRRSSVKVIKIAVNKSV